jgi:hypothetical protein
MLFDAIHIRALGIKGTRDGFVLPQRMRKRASLVSARRLLFHVAAKLGAHKAFLFFLFVSFLSIFIVSFSFKII